MEPKFTHLLDFIDHIKVVCPNCQQMASVLSDREDRDNTRFVCPDCGRTKEWHGSGSTHLATDDLASTDGILLGSPVDCFFRLPLWYACEVKGHTLFAYNLEHLSFLKDFVADRLRERRQDEHGWRNSSLESRLPSWMLSAKNRAHVVKAIDLLMAKDH